MATFLPNLRTDNIALYTVPVFFMISLYPRFYSMTTYRQKTSRVIDGRRPREFAGAIAQDAALDSATKGRLVRAEAASANGIENFGPFAAATTAASLARVDPLLVNTLTLGYLASRVAYNWVYINNETVAQARLRAVVYLSGIAMLFGLFGLAGNKLRAA